eukprot:68243-Amphidinium_carterae.1
MVQHLHDDIITDGFGGRNCLGAPDSKSPGMHSRPCHWGRSQRAQPPAAGTSCSPRPGLPSCRRHTASRGSVRANGECWVILVWVILLW